MSKSKFPILAAVFLLALALFSCSSNDNGNEGVSSSSSGIQQSSSSSAVDCESLNNYTMAIEMNLNEPVVVKKNNAVLVEGVNYNVTTTANSIKVQGLRDYIGSVEHASSSSTSRIVVKDGGRILVENTDYAVIETGNSVRIVGINNYYGSVAVELPCEPPAITPPTITTASLPSATVGTAYSKTLAATGDTPIAWSIQSGVLPAGLSLSASGVISGTPTAAGTFSVTIRATNTGGYDQKTFSISVQAAVVPSGLMYHGVAYTLENIPSSQDITTSINMGQMVSSTVNTSAPTTLRFAGEGRICIMIPNSYPPIASIKNAMNQEILAPVGNTIVNKGQIQYNGSSYTLYTQISTGLFTGVNLVMSF